MREKKDGDAGKWNGSGSAQRGGDGTRRAVDVCVCLSAVARSLVSTGAGRMTSLGG